MDFPIFHLDGMGNRMLIAVIAILHVLITLGLAVGAMPLIAFLEWRGIKTGDRRWDDLAYRFLFFCFIITTTVGALTGVGIWLSASLVNPYSIGSLIRIFFWGWFLEWIIFVTEVALILIYCLTWKKWIGEQKEKHNRFGWALGIFSWITMALIVAILAFMMNTGDWKNKPSLWVAFFNPLYLPQLSFRTPLALVTAGLLGMFLTYFFIRNDREFRNQALQLFSKWVIFFLPPLALGAWWYWSSVPRAMSGHIATALTTMGFTQWHEHLLKGSLLGILVISAISLLGLWKPNRVPRFAVLLPFVITLMLLGYFERIREFIRKPYVIPGYMYSNTYRLEDYPLLQKEGVLAHATYCVVKSSKEITSSNQVDAGRDVFMLTCTRCHTSDGMNGVVAKFEKILGTGEWDREVVANYVENMHGSRTFMPPFPGNAEELKALAAYLSQLRQNPEQSLGSQNEGINGVPAKNLNLSLNPQ